MTRIGLLMVATTSLVLSACGDGSWTPGNDGGIPPVATQYVAPSDSAFVAAVDPTNPGIYYGPTQGQYAGARLIVTATVQAGSPTTHDQAQYAQLYKANDGHLYRVDLLTVGTPAPTQVSSEATATVDDTCSLNGANTTAGTDVNYLAVQAFVDYANPENSAYFYRLPGADGTCNTADDTVHLAKLGMSTTDAPIDALMPIAAVHDGGGALTGFIVNEGTALTLYDQNFQNRTVLSTSASTIAVAYGLASTGVAATGALFVVDGSIVYVDYGKQTVSAALFTIPNWDPAKRIVNSANGMTAFFAVNTSNEAVTPVVPRSEVYAMPLDGSAAPTALMAESGLVSQVTVAIYGSTVAWSVVPPGGAYTIRTLAPGGQVLTALTAPANGGSFIVTANDIYYTVYAVAETAPHTIVYANTQTGIVGMDGTVVEAPMLDSRFVGQQRDADGSDWLAVFRARGLMPVTLLDAANGYTYTEDGISGATVETVSTSSNAVALTLGTLAAGTIMQGTGTVTGSVGYLDGINVNSNGDPATRDLIYLDTGRAGSLTQLTTNLH